MPGADNSRIPPLPGQNFDVMSLTDQDEIILQAVLQKDDVEMRILETRISELRKEIQDIRSASALVGGDDQSSICARCKFKFPAFSLPWADRGRRCNACKFKVCSRCCFTQSNGWLLCILCLKCRQEKLLTGEWMSTGQRDHLHGSQLLKALLRDRRRVPRSAYEETKIPTNYTQRPAKIQDGDSESRTSKNSQSSLEAADLRQQEKLASAKKAIDTKEEEHVLDDGKRGLSVQHHRDSYFRALESADITVRHPKGNKHINKHHWWQKVSRPVHARDEVAPLAQSSDLESETSSLSSFSLDSQHASRGTNNDSSCEDRESLTRKRFRQGSTVSELAKRTVDLPAALPSRFRFRRTSSVSDNDVQERRLINDHSKQQMAVSDERINASKIQVQPLWNETKTNTSQPSKHQRLLPNIDGTLKNSSIQASKNMHPAPITGTSIQHVSHDDKNSRKKPPTSGNFEEVYNSSVNRLVTFMTGGNTPAQTESRDNSNPSQIKKEEQQSSDTGKKSDIIPLPFSSCPEKSRETHTSQAFSENRLQEDSLYKLSLPGTGVVEEYLLHPSEIKITQNPFVANRSPANCKSTSKVEIHLQISKRPLRKCISLSYENILSNLLRRSYSCDHEETRSSPRDMEETTLFSRDQEKTKSKPCVPEENRPLPCDEEDTKSRHSSDHVVDRCCLSGQENINSSLSDQEETKLDSRDQEEPEFYSRDQEETKLDSRDQEETQFCSRDQEEPEFYSRDQEEPEFYSRDQEETKLYSRDQEETEVYARDRENTQLYLRDQTEPKFYSRDQDETPFYSRDQVEPKFYSREQEETQFYSSDQEETKLYSSDHEETQFYSHNQEEPQFYSRDHEETQLYSRDQEETKCSSPDLEEIQFNTRDREETQFYSRDQEETRSYPSDHEETGAEESINKSNKHEFKIRTQIPQDNYGDLTTNSSTISSVPTEESQIYPSNLPEELTEHLDGTQHAYTARNFLCSGSDVSDTLSIVTEVPEPCGNDQNGQLDPDQCSDATLNDTRYEDSFSDDDFGDVGQNAVIIFGKSVDESDVDCQLIGSQSLSETSSMQNYLHLSFEKEEDKSKTDESSGFHEQESKKFAYLCLDQEEGFEHEVDHIEYKLLISKETFNRNADNMLNRNRDVQCSLDSIEKLKYVPGDSAVGVSSEESDGDQYSIGDIVSDNNLSETSTFQNFYQLSVEKEDEDDRKVDNNYDDGKTVIPGGLETIMDTNPGGFIDEASENIDNVTDIILMKSQEIKSNDVEEVNDGHNTTMDETDVLLDDEVDLKISDIFDNCYPISHLVDSAGRSKPEPKPTLLSLAMQNKGKRSPSKYVSGCYIPEVTTDSDAGEIEKEEDRTEKLIADSQTNIPERRHDDEPIKETDSGITSGQTTRTNTPEQRLQPQKSLSDQSSVPTINVTNIGGENYREENDDLDELFYNHQPNHLLGSRSSLADSRESIYSVYSDAGEVNYGRFPVTGEIMFNITYDSKSTTLKIHVKQCRDLAAVDNKHNRSDPYVKTYLLPDKTRASKRKTRIKKHTLNPVFDEILQYKIRSDELASRSLWLTVWHNDRLGRNDFLGEVTIPLDYYPFDNSKPMWYPLQERIVTQEPVMYYKGDLFISLKYVPADMVEVAAPKKVKSNSFRKKGKHKERETANSNLGEIQVLVREAQNLTAMRDVGGSDPFCKGYCRNLCPSYVVVVVVKDPAAYGLRSFGPCPS